MSVSNASEVELRSLIPDLITEVLTYGVYTATVPMKAARVGKPGKSPGGKRRFDEPATWHVNLTTPINYRANVKN